MSNQAQNPLDNVVAPAPDPETVKPGILIRVKNFALAHKFATGVVTGAAAAYGAAVALNLASEEDENPEDPTPAE